MTRSTAMRIAAVLGLLAAGCNQVFGLDPTDPLPEAPDASTLSHVKLTWQIANTLPAGPDPLIEYAPIEPAPIVRVGRVDGPLIDAVYRPDGSIEIPDDFPGTIWRLEYTLDGVAHEVHWSPARNQGHVIVPRAGRLRRDPVPNGGGYRIVPTGGPSTHPRARVYTTGIWTDGEVASGTATVDYPFANARSLSGPIGAPDENHGDDGVLVDLVAGPTPGCTVAGGSASFVTPTMTGSLSQAAPTYVGSASDANISYATLVFLPARLDAVLGGRKGPAPSEARTVLGHIASASLPDFTEQMPGLQLVSGPVLPGPALLALADCDTLPAHIDAAARPAALTAFPLVVHAELSDQRRTAANGPFLRSGIAAAMTSTTETYNLDMRVTFALEPIRLGAIDLAAADRVTVPISSGRLELTFAVEPASPPAHYYELVLHEVESGTSPRLIRRRVYTSSMPSIMFDTSVLTAGKEYVFSIHAYLGRPLASTGDYTRIEYPQAMTTVFTRTLVAQ